MAEERRSHILQSRMEKLDELRRRGIEPYAYRFDPTHRTLEARELFEAAEKAGELAEGGHGPTVRLAGRMVSQRLHGKTQFVDLADQSGRIQLYLRKDVLGEEGFEFLSLLDIG